MRGSALELGLVATPLPRTSRHDAERTLAQVVLALADGATCLSDLAALRAQPAEFGEVASEARVWRIFNHAAPVELRGIARARAGVRARAWAAGAGPASDEVVIDIDSTISPHQGRQARRRTDLQTHLRP